MSPEVSYTPRTRSRCQKVFSRRSSAVTVTFLKKWHQKGNVAYLGAISSINLPYLWRKVLKRGFFSEKLWFCRETLHQKVISLDTRAWARIVFECACARNKQKILAQHAKKSLYQSMHLKIVYAKFTRSNTEIADQCFPTVYFWSILQIMWFLIAGVSSNIHRYTKVTLCFQILFETMFSACVNFLRRAHNAQLKMWRTPSTLCFVDGEEGGEVITPHVHILQQTFWCLRHWLKPQASCFSSHWMWVSYL